MFHHPLGAFFYGAIGYLLIQAVFVSFWGIRALRFRQAEFIANDLESTIRGWLDDSGLSPEPVSTPEWNFGLLTMLPDGESISIVQLKTPRRFLAFQANIAISPAHQAILKAMPSAYFDNLAQEVVLKVFLAKMVLATRTRLSGVTLISQLAITPNLTKREFLRQMDDMRNAITLARNTILHGVERAPRLVNPRDVRIDEQR
jgi:hypothetical protein